MEKMYMFLPLKPDCCTRLQWMEEIETPNMASLVKSCVSNHQNTALWQNEQSAFALRHTVWALRERNNVHMIPFMPDCIPDLKNVFEMDVWKVDFEILTFRKISKKKSPNIFLIIILKSFQTCITFFSLWEKKVNVFYCDASFIYIF